MPIDLARTPAFGARTFVAPLLAALLALGFARSANAQTHDLMEGRGRDVSLPVSCGADIQPRFDAALAALHSFWYGQALKEFTAITEAKPDCAMAYWGIAMTAWTQIWAPPTPASLKTGSEAIARALALGGTTPRERDYLEALAAFYADHDKLDHRTRASAYMRKMEGLAQRYPDDVEARLFYALSLLATADGLDKTYKNQLQAGAILEQVFAQKPQHPGPSHYIIHAYDYPALVERALAELAGAGIATADSFAGLRALLAPQEKRRALVEAAGRWSLLLAEKTDNVESVARTLLKRYGVVFRAMLVRETQLPPWRDIVRVYRRLEARGEIRGGRFVAGFGGEQFAAPDAVGRLRAVRKSEKIGELVVVSGADPLNMVGILTPEARVPGVYTNRILLRDGLPIAALEGGEVRRLAESEINDEQLRGFLARRALRRPANLHPRTMTTRESKALASRIVH